MFSFCSLPKEFSLKNDKRNFDITVIENWRWIWIVFVEWLFEYKGTSTDLELFYT